MNMGFERNVIKEKIKYFFGLTRLVRIYLDQSIYYEKSIQFILIVYEVIIDINKTKYHRSHHDNNTSLCIGLKKIDLIASKNIDFTLS